MHFAVAHFEYCFSNIAVIINFVSISRLCCHNRSLAENIGLPNSLHLALSSSSLREVDLSYNYYSQGCIEHLIKAWEYSHSKIETLRSYMCLLFLLSKMDTTWNSQQSFHCHVLSL